MSGSVLASVIGAIGFVLFVAFVRLHKRSATSTTPPVPIVTFELIGSGLGAFDLLARLGADGRAAVRRCLILDNGVIVGYVATYACFGVSAVLAVSHRCQGGIEAIGVAAGVLAAAGGLIAGCGDLIENARLRKVLAAWRDPQPGAAPTSDAGQLRRDVGGAMDQPAQQAAAAARVKFALLTVGLVALAGAWTVAYAAR